MNETSQLRAALAGQARSAAAAFRAAEAYFLLPVPARLEEARRLASAAEEEARRADAGLARFSEGPLRRTAFQLARALDKMRAAGGAALDESARFSLPSDPRLQDLAREAAWAAAAVAEALADASPDATPTVRAKKAGGRLDSARRAAETSLKDDPNAVAAMKVREICRRYSDAALHADEAADLIGELLLAEAA